MKTLNGIWMLMTILLSGFFATVQGTLLTPPQIWKAYDPNKGDSKEEIVKEEINLLPCKEMCARRKVKGELYDTNAMDLCELGIENQ